MRRSVFSLLISVLVSGLVALGACGGVQDASFQPGDLTSDGGSDGAAQVQGGAAGHAGRAGAGGGGAKAIIGSGGRAGAAGTAGTGTIGGTGGGSTGGTSGTCGDTHEPNNTQAQATDVTSIDRCAAVQQVSAALSGPSDVDWYRYTGMDNYCTIFNDTISPYAATTASSATVCIYSTIATTPQCATGTEANDISGYKGCCGSGQAQLKDFGVTLHSAQNATILMRVTGSSSTPACQSYTLSYQYNKNP